MKKKLVSIMMASVMVLGLTACGKSQDATPAPAADETAAEVSTEAPADASDEAEIGRAHV